MAKLISRKLRSAAEKIGRAMVAIFALTARMLLRAQGGEKEPPRGVAHRFRAHRGVQFQIVSGRLVTGRTFAGTRSS
jgi:hypothetical protein